MSGRNRAAPWFLNRTPTYRERVMRWVRFGICEWQRQWSFDGVTWFDGRGRVAHQGDYPVLFEREYIGTWVDGLLS